MFLRQRKLGASYFGGCLCGVLLSLMTTATSADELATGDLSSIDRLVTQLDHDSYTVRRQSKRRLFELTQSPETKEYSVQAIVQATKSPILEIHENASRLLLEIELAEVERQLSRLMDVTVAADAIDLPFWNRYRKMAGSDLDARRLFAKTLRQHDAAIRLLAQYDPVTKRDSVLHRNTPAYPRWQLARLLNPHTIAADDAVLWTIHLCADDRTLPLGLAGLSTQTMLVLSQNEGGPQIGNSGEAAVLRRVVGNWIAKDRGTGLQRERMLIALKYQCDQQARALCDQVLGDRFASASAHSMALLCASKLKRSDLRELLRQWIGDDRTAHVWTLIASRKAKIRTQVGDVALALLLHHHGIDPRQAGFHDLQADPRTIFREHSLGFSDQATRSAAYKTAAELIQSVSN
ncbi:hypothetical protein [Planctomycetes bacterium K23_9]|uniref:HEAT repeat protein n=1 Tax=Stieleria marina TaxID=1930275 RepID=A0A517NUU6_9BACT|nr:hypothetical protein K239x_28810 [Planctomycetes bacterium K23_9]